MSTHSQIPRQKMMLKCQNIFGVVTSSVLLRAAQEKKMLGYKNCLGVHTANDRWKAEWIFRTY